MELVEGETLAQRITRGPIPIKEALEIAKQIAEALDAAHERGIVHRDLKPGNVKITPDGKVKVLDFGLAKALESSPTNTALSHSPTLSMAATNVGMILGTAAYMSPEQAKGRAVDKRTDIFSFGCVLYETLTGRPTFDGDDVSEILARVIEREPDWSKLPSKIPPKIQELLRLCLEKDVTKRRRDAGDVRIDIEKALAEPVAVISSGTRVRASRLAWVAFAFAVLMAAALAAVTAWKMKPSAPAGFTNVTRLTVNLPPGEQLAGLSAGSLNIAISPDGTRIVYLAERAGHTQLFLRMLSDEEPKPIPGTEGAINPFFSPDGEWIGFVAQAKLKKVSVIGGGAPRALCDAGSNRGGTWGPDGTIYFALSSGVWKVSASGGEPQQVTQVDYTKGETQHQWPHLLPGGQALLFAVQTGNGWDESNIVGQFLETGEQKVLVHGASIGRYSNTRHVIYSRQGRLLAVPMDPVRLEVMDTSPVTISDGVRLAPGNIGANFDVSSRGVLAYYPASPHQFDRRLVLVDRTGTVAPLPVPPRPYEELVLSPDGLKVAVQIIENTREINIYDLSRGILSQLTSGPGSSSDPVWSADGTRVTYRAYRDGIQGLLWRQANSSGSEERLTTVQTSQTPFSWSPDGKALALTINGQTTSNDIWIFRPERGNKPELFVQTPEYDGGARFSPDGHWLSYEAGGQIYVQAFPGPGAKWQISTDGGSEPTMWSRNGRELFYENDDKVMVVGITTSPSFSAGKPNVLFQKQLFADSHAPYDVFPDGQQFIAIEPVEPEHPATQINLVLNWHPEPGK
jgi:eukaryotic-like serine/threonine-protein kinase